MSVTTTTYTTNSRKITIATETSSTNIISAVDSAIVALGWTLYDTVTATTFSPMVTKVYRVLNYDGITYKYLILRFDTIKLQLVVSTCESWNTGTQRPLNESWGNAGLYIHGYDLINSYFIISATARHFMIWNFVNNQPGLWSAVLEFERIAAEDLASVSTSPYPCWCYTNSLMLGTPHGTTAAGNGTIMMAWPRLPDGSTGVAAAQAMAPVTNRGMFPPIYPQDSTVNYLVAGSDTNYLHLGSYFKNFSYSWDPAKTPISPISVDGITTSQPFGRAYNMGITKSVGTAGDTVLANIDATGGWPSSTGSSVESFLLPLNGGWEGSAAYGSGQLTNIYGNTVVAAGKCIGIGDNVWFAANDGIRTQSISAGQGASSTRRLLDSSGIYDIVYDGQRTIYGSSGNGIVKIDTLTYANSWTTSAQTIANGCGYLGIDAKNIYATSRTANTRPSMHVCDINTFTIATANTYVFSANSLGAPGALGLFSTPVPDYTGNIYLSVGISTANATVGNSFVQSVNATGGFNTQARGTWTNQYNICTGMYLDTFQTNKLWQFATYTRPSYDDQTGNVVEITSTTSTLAPARIGGPTTVGTYSSFIYSGIYPGPHSYFDYAASVLGDLYVTTFRGHLQVGGKLQGIIGATSTNRFTWTALPYTNTAAVTTVTTRTGNLTAGAFGITGGFYTNGVTAFALSRPTANENRLYIINGLYNTTPINGTATGRVILKG